jgi:hypothetical protein
MTYTEIEISEYLLPHTELNILEKRNMFAVKHRMSTIREIFPQNKKKFVIVGKIC